MKTIKIACLSLMTSFVLLTACSKDELETIPTVSQNESAYKTTKPGILETKTSGWREDFTSAASLTKRFNLYGESQPQWVRTAANRFGLFDNNGSLPNGSFAVSKVPIGNGNGYMIESEVYIDVKEPKRALICPEIGVTKPMLPSTSEPGIFERGISMKIIYLGEDTPGVPLNFQKQAYVQMSVLMIDDQVLTTTDPMVVPGSTPSAYAFRVQATASGWHNLKIVVSAKHMVSFYLDNRFVWSPEKRINNCLMSNANLFLGYLSGGEAGKAYHDFVKVTYPKIRSTPDLSTTEVIAY